MENIWYPLPHLINPGPSTNTLFFDVFWSFPVAICFLVHIPHGGHVNMVWGSGTYRGFTKFGRIYIYLHISYIISAKPNKPHSWQRGVSWHSYMNRVWNIDLSSKQVTKRLKVYKYKYIYICICQCVYTYTIPREPIYDIFHALQLLCIYTKKSYTMELFIYIYI